MKGKSERDLDRDRDLDHHSPRKGAKGQEPLKGEGKWMVRTLANSFASLPALMMGQSISQSVNPQCLLLPVQCSNLGDSQSLSRREIDSNRCFLAVRLDRAVALNRSSFQQPTRSPLFPLASTLPLFHAQPFSYPVFSRSLALLSSCLSSPVEAVLPKNPSFSQPAAQPICSPPIREGSGPAPMYCTACVAVRCDGAVHVRYSRARWWRQWHN